MLSNQQLLRCHQSFTVSRWDNFISRIVHAIYQHCGNRAVSYHMSGSCSRRWPICPIKSHGVSYSPTCPMSIFMLPTLDSPAKIACKCLIIARNSRLACIFCRQESSMRMPVSPEILLKTSPKGVLKSKTCGVKWACKATSGIFLYQTSRYLLSKSCCTDALSIQS